PFPPPLAISRTALVAEDRLDRLHIQRATAAVDQRLKHLAQPPYSLLLRQGVCDLRQACGVGDMSKTISFFCKADPRLARLAGHVLVSVQDDLGGKGRVPADFH